MIIGTEPSMPVVETNNYDGHLLNEMHYPGLTIRQYFAVMSLQGLLSRNDFSITEPIYSALWSVAHADALIKELNKTDNP